MTCCSSTLGLYIIPCMHYLDMFRIKVMYELKIQNTRYHIYVCFKPKKWDTILEYFKYPIIRICLADI